MIPAKDSASRLPAVQEKVRQLIGKEPSHSVNPDECVAIGAAIQCPCAKGCLPEPCAV